MKGAKSCKLKKASPARRSEKISLQELEEDLHPNMKLGSDETEVRVNGDGIQRGGRQRAAARQANETLSSIGNRLKEAEAQEQTENRS